ncbi:MAG: hypothetical protein ACUVWP_02090 [bacterium]
MIYKILLMIISLIPFIVLAGTIISGECSNCGYNTSQLFIGGGKTPGLYYYLYSSSELKQLFIVGFDFIEIFTKEHETEISLKDTYDRADFIIKNYEEFNKFLISWEPPSEMMTDKMPYGSKILKIKDEDLSRVECTLTLIDAPYDGEFKLCPSCSEVKLKFKIEGKWD